MTVNAYGLAEAHLSFLFPKICFISLILNKGSIRKSEKNCYYYSCA
ncbi:hypothetical protein K661_00489 [Piscirickettsia salmonis LF-89 = ATCC VR-1361]|nr:hypothetical protein K661_00489 [Piscirickettsia salmonis LF-89 = ATCC VR-1361]